MTGRVWGAGAGKAPSPTTIRTRQDRASPTTASVKARQWKSGSGPTRKSTSAPGSSVTLADHRAGPGELGGHAVHDAGHRTAGPLVQEVLAVEGDERLGGPCAEQRRRWPSVAPSPASTQPSRATTSTGRSSDRLAVHLEDLGHARGLGAHGVASSDSAAISARRPTWTGNPSTLPWSPAPAPAT